MTYAAYVSRMSYAEWVVASAWWKGIGGGMAWTEGWPGESVKRRNGES